jgi:hypothetical protein
MVTKATLWVDDGAQVHFFHGGRTVGHDGADDVGLGGVGGGGLAVSLFDLRGNSGATCLTFPSMAPAPLSAPLAKGHQCLFAVLHDVNFCPQKSHFHCGRPLMASLAHFCCSCLDVQFLFHASCFFSFWACDWCLWPLVRSKKARGPSSLRSSKI